MGGGLAGVGAGIKDWAGGYYKFKSGACLSNQGRFWVNQERLGTETLEYCEEICHKYAEV